MKRIFAFSAFIAFVACAAHAQDDASVAAERARLKAAREEVEAGYVAEEKACYGKFAVNDCLSAARAKRREALGDLRRQEIALNDAERKRKAAERQRSIDERNAQQREREGAGSPSASQSQQDRAMQANERAASRAAQAASAPQRAAQREKQVREKEAQLKASAQQREQDAAKAAKEHDKRVVDAQEHAEALKRRQAERTKPPASSLADPK